MKPSSLPELCSIKSSTSCAPSPSCSFLPLSEMQPQPKHTARTTKQKSWDKQQARTGLQPRFHAWPSFILCIPRRHFNYQAARGQNKELVTCQNNQALRDASAISMRSAQENREKGCQQQGPVLHWGNPSPRSQCWTPWGSQSSCVTREHNAVTTKINHAIKIQHEQKDVGTEQESVSSGDKEVYSHWYSDMHSNIRLFTSCCP